MTAIGPFDTLLDALLVDIAHQVERRCAENLRLARHEAEHARRSLGQSFRWVTSEITGVMR